MNTDRNRVTSAIGLSLLVMALLLAIAGGCDAARGDGAGGCDDWFELTAVEKPRPPAPAARNAAPAAPAPAPARKAPSLEKKPAAPAVPPAAGLPVKEPMPSPTKTKKPKHHDVDVCDD
ncbi:hypothetical protein [Streptomyces niveus]|uniref:hypothetical protein n=1 Tax=Streptomyces niveus TaxID=193462 RepID=UPI0036D2FC1D